MTTDQTEGIFSVAELRGILACSGTMFSRRRARVILGDALAQIDRLTAVLRQAVAEAGHAEHCLEYDFSRPYFGPRSCDCWLSAAERVLSELAELEGTP